MIKDASFILLRILAVFLAMTTGFLIGAEKYIGSKIEEYQRKTSTVKAELERYRRTALKADELLRKLKKSSLPTVRLLALSPQEADAIIKELKDGGLTVSSTKRGEFLIIRASGSSDRAVEAVRKVWPNLLGALAGLESYREDKDKVSFTLKLLLKIKKGAGR
jgi:hypothetical protein